MASPFAVFRKYQAMLLVVFGVLIIVVFTIGDSVSRISSDSGGSEQDEVVVKWDGTELKKSRLQAIQVSRIIGDIIVLTLSHFLPAGRWAATGDSLTRIVFWRCKPPL